MYFAKNEIIELSNGENYLVLDSIEINNETYYKVELVDVDKKEKTDQIKYISVTNKDGKLYISEGLPQEKSSEPEEKKES